MGERHGYVRVSKGAQYAKKSQSKRVSNWTQHCSTRSVHEIKHCIRSRSHIKHDSHVITARQMLAERRTWHGGIW